MSQTSLYIGSCSDELKRQNWFNLLSQQPFSQNACLGTKRATIYTQELIEDYNMYSPEDLKAELAQEWQSFLEGDLEQIKQVITDAQFE